MSGRKSNLRLFKALVDGDMSQATLTSTVSCIQWLDNICYEFVWTGSPVGVLSVEVSANHAQDELGNVTVLGDWVPLTFSYWNGSTFVTDFSIPTSVGSPVFLDLALLSAPWIRAKYTKTSGTGVLQAFISAKQV